MASSKDLGTEIRKDLILKHTESKTPHIGSEFSCLDLLLSLYFEVMTANDKFVLSKGHAAPALYAVLNKKGLISKELYDSYGKNGTILAEHPSHGVAGVEVATGSLGHGLPIAVGMAMAKKLAKNPGRVFVLLSDGEMQEGSTMEAMNAATRFNLDNLVAIIDSNKWQAYDRTADIVAMSKVEGEFAASGWAVTKINGHAEKEITNSLKNTPIKVGKPSLIVADTVLGKGVKMMEDNLDSHYKPPTPEQAKEYLTELDG